MGFFSIIYPSHLLVLSCMYECIWIFLPEINLTFLLNAASATSWCHCPHIHVHVPSLCHHIYGIRHVIRFDWITKSKSKLFYWALCNKHVHVDQLFLIKDMYVLLHHYVLYDKHGDVMMYFMTNMVMSLCTLWQTCWWHDVLYDKHGDVIMYFMTNLLMAWCTLWQTWWCHYVLYDKHGDVIMYFMTNMVMSLCTLWQTCWCHDVLYDKHGDVIRYFMTNMLMSLGTFTTYWRHGVFLKSWRICRILWCHHVFLDVMIYFLT